MKLGHNWQRILRESTGHLKAFFLIGPPSVGKSSWIEQEGPNHGLENPYVINSDDIVDEYALKNDLTYDEIFEQKPIQPGQPGYTDTQSHPVYGEIVDNPIGWKSARQPKSWKKIAKAESEGLAEYDKIIEGARDSGRPIVIDLTNMNKGSRDFMKSRLKAPDHEMIAVVFDWNDDVQRLKDSAKKRNQDRIDTTGRPKTIPDHVIDGMVSNYQAPVDGEFDQVIHVPAWWTLQNEEN